MNLLHISINIITLLALQMGLDALGSNVGSGSVGSKGCAGSNVGSKGCPKSK